MLIVFIRTMLMYFIVLFILRIMGKAELSKMSPFQMVVVFMIAELASIPIESTEVSIITGVTAIFTLMFIQILISYISLKNESFKNFFSGKPSILIDKGKINNKELKELRITINDLMEQLRIGNAASISDVEYAVMETNGDLSIIPKSINKPLTASDLSITKPEENLPVIFISDGIIYKKNILKSGWTEKKLLDELLQMEIHACDDVFLAFCDSSSKLHVYIAENSYGYAKEVNK